MSESRVRENRTHGSMRRREAARCRWPHGPKGRDASRRPYNGAVSDVTPRRLLWTTSDSTA